MAIPKTGTRPQISLDTGVYGSLPPEGFPEPTANEDAQIAFWHKDAYGAGQWLHVKMRSGTGIDISYDPDSGILSFTNSDYIVAATFTADAVLAGRILADAVLLQTTSATFDGNAVLE